MKILLSYATTQGQTRKIMRRVGDQIADAGHMVELLALSDAGDVDLDRFDAVILAGSVHVGRYQRALTEFASKEAGRLGAKKTLFLSVSLAACGHDAEDWQSLDRIAEDFSAATGWTPGQIAQVAGAYTPSQYDIFSRFIMRRIIAARDPDADPHKDIEYTDWPALRALIADWLAG